MISWSLPGLIACLRLLTVAAATTKTECNTDLNNAAIMLEPGHLQENGPIRMLTFLCQILLKNCRMSTNTPAIFYSQLEFSLVKFLPNAPVQGPQL